MAEFIRRPQRGLPKRENRGPIGNPPNKRGQTGGSSGGGHRSRTERRAAVPWYVGQNFGDAPPGHRYLSYLPFWKADDDWSLITEGKQGALKEVGLLPVHVQDLMHSLAARQRALGQAVGAEIISAVSTSPLATGLGSEHPNENGFAFLQPYGLPYLPGSGIKGVVRKAAQKLARESAGDHGWNQDLIDLFFGLEPPSGSDDASQGALCFFDVIPELAGNRMDVDIMNPHYGDYYQGKSTPHDAGRPIPIFFLVVPPKSKFTFVVGCWRKLPEDLATHWRRLIRAAFEYAVDWLGFGAKTAVGYGAMSLVAADATVEATLVPAAEGKRTATEPTSKSPSSTLMATEEIWDQVTITWNAGGGGVLTAEGKAPGQRATAQGKLAQEIRDKMSDDRRKQLFDRKRPLTNVKVVVEKLGNQKTLKRLVD